MTPTPADLVDTALLSRDRTAHSGRVSVAALARLAPLLLAADGELGYSLRGEVDELGRAAASLDVRGDLRLRCDLCERELVIPLRLHASYFFVADAAALDALPLEGDDEREPIVGGRRFDVVQLVEDETILALPISPRHPECEAALEGAANEAAANQGVTNEGVTNDGATSIRPSPFAALAGFRGRRSG